MQLLVCSVYKCKHHVAMLKTCRNTTYIIYSFPTYVYIHKHMWGDDKYPCMVWAKREVNKIVKYKGLQLYNYSFVLFIKAPKILTQLHQNVKILQNYVINTLLFYSTLYTFLYAWHIFFKTPNLIWITTNEFCCQ